MLLLLLSRFSRVWLCSTLQTAARHAPPSLGFSRQEHWSGLPFPSQCMKVKSESEVAQSQLFETPWTAAYQASLSMGFSRQEYWSGVPLPSPYKHDFCRKYISQQNKSPNKLICWICDFQNVVSVPPASASSGNLLEMQILRPYQDLLNKNSRAGAQKFVF